MGEFPWKRVCLSLNENSLGPNGKDWVEVRWEFGQYLSTEGFPDSSAGKESACHAGDPGLNLGLGRSPGEGKGYRLQYSGLENSMDCISHGVTKSQTRLSDFHLSRKYRAGWR